MVLLAGSQGTPSRNVTDWRFALTDDCRRMGPVAVDMGKCAFVEAAGLLSLEVVKFGERGIIKLQMPVPTDLVRLPHDTTN